MSEDTSPEDYQVAGRGSEEAARQGQGVPLSPSRLQAHRIHDVNDITLLKIPPPARKVTTAAGQRHELPQPGTIPVHSNPTSPRPQVLNAAASFKAASEKGPKKALSFSEPEDHPDPSIPGPGTLSSSVGRSFGSSNERLTLPKALKDKMIGTSVHGEKLPMWVIHPHTSRMRLWDFWTFLLLAFTAIGTPYELAFLEKHSTKIHIDALWVVNRVVDACFVVDLILQCMLAYETEDGVWVKRQPEIVRHYVRTWLFIDVISVMPFDLLTLLFNKASLEDVRVLRLLRIFRVLKLLRLVRASRILSKVEAAIAVNYTVLKLVKYIGFALMICHWLACGFRMVVNLAPELEVDEEARTWVATYSWFEPAYGPFGEYIVALYWSVATISTLGYGDVIPVTDYERAYCVVATLIGGGVYAYTVASCTGIIAAMNESQTHFFRLMDTLNTFMAERKLPHWLQCRLRDYFKYRRQVNLVKDWHALVSLISPALKAQVAVHANIFKLRPCHCHEVPREVNCRRFAFCGLQDEFIADLSVRIKPMVACPHEYIVRKGERATELFIVEKGVAYCGDRQRVVSRGGVIGADMLFRDVKRYYGALTLTHVVFAALEHGALQEVLAIHPTERAMLRSQAVRTVFRNYVLLYARNAGRFKRNMHKLRLIEMERAAFGIAPSPSFRGSTAAKKAGQVAGGGGSAPVDRMGGEGGAGMFTRRLSMQLSSRRETNEGPTQEEMDEANALENDKFHKVNEYVVPVIMMDYIENLKRTDPHSFQQFEKARLALTRVVIRIRSNRRRAKRKAQATHHNAMMVRLRDLLFSEGFSQYEMAFEEHNVNFETLAECDPQALCTIGVKLGDAIQILRAYRTLRS